MGSSLTEPEGELERRGREITTEYRKRHPRSFDVRLRDGRWVRIRPIVRADKDEIARGLERLSARSRYLRFHRYVERLNEAELQYLADVDQRVHVAWGAFALDQPGRPGIAAARFVRDTEDATWAELSVTVADDYQGVGLGRIITELLLLSAVEGGVERLVAYVLPENLAAIRLFRSVGAEPPQVDDDVLRLEIPVSTPNRTYRRSGEMVRLGDGAG